MITSLALSNFKSIGKTLIVNDEDITEGKLEFAPLTIFCGKNSSGKSTVLQSILLLAQTIQNNVPSQTIVLNGPMVKLGSVDDIKSSFLKSDDVSITIDFDTNVPIKDLINIIKEYPSIKKKSKFVSLEEEIDLENEGYGILKYSLSNNLDDINTAIFNRTGFLFDLDDSKWKENNGLSPKVKELMDKYNVNYSMTTYSNNNINQLIINKRSEDNWLYKKYYEVKGIFITDADLIEKTYIQSGISLFNNTENNQIKQNINLCISLSNKRTNDISNIIPIINQISIKSNYYLHKNQYSFFFNAFHKNLSRKNNFNIKEINYFKLDFDDYTKSKVRKAKKKDNKLLGLKLFHFLPEYFLYGKIPIEEVKLAFFVQFIKDSYNFDDQSVHDFNAHIILLSNYIKEPEKKKLFIKQCKIPENVFINKKEIFKQYVNKSILQLLDINIDSSLTELVTSTLKKRNIKTYIPAEGELCLSIKDSVKSIANLLKNNLDYIGPLREEPHLQYNKYDENIIKVDKKGENAASVLFHYKNEERICFNSSDFMDKRQNIKPLKKYLYETVNDWLKYIGVAESINVEFKGRYGYELKIIPIKNRETKTKVKDYDLTNVGVGVSQVLPIVLACLIASEESTIIIEQPELHLHPAMQTKLTDFFIATMLCNKQLIIETHSEYIINHLRLRVVNCPTKEPINDKLMIYFTENLKEDYKEYKAGNTTFRKLEINEYAAMSDWPDGFFDESSKTADEIIKAAFLKWEQDKGDK